MIYNPEIQIMIEQNVRKKKRPNAHSGEKGNLTVQSIVRCIFWKE